MYLDRETLQKVLELAAEKGDEGFKETDISALFQNNEYDLVFHLDYLTEKGYIDGKFTSGAYAAFALLPKPIHFIEGKITDKGRAYLQQLQEQATATE